MLKFLNFIGRVNIKDKFLFLIVIGMVCMEIMNMKLIFTVYGNSWQRMSASSDYNHYYRTNQLAGSIPSQILVQVIKGRHVTLLGNVDRVAGIFSLYSESVDIQPCDIPDSKAAVWRESFLKGSATNDFRWFGFNSCLSEQDVEYLRENFKMCNKDYKSNLYICDSDTVLSDNLVSIVDNKYNAYVMTEEQWRSMDER